MQLIRILSGSFVPLWFFPQWVQKVSAFLPFIYIYQTPLSIYIGKINVKQAFQSMLIQFVWILILSFILSRIWKKACRMVTVQGG
jgi:ABC-2 type transport system permease protein